MRGKKKKNTIFSMSCLKLVSEAQHSTQLAHNFLKDYYDSHSRCRKHRKKSILQTKFLFSRVSPAFILIQKQRVGHLDMQ